ncbi:hypothetical protein BDW72DRAFT_183926 [Aspergillus terricola var. indicus]
MAFQRTMSLHRTLLYLLSLSAGSRAIDQDVLQDSNGDSSDVSRILLTKTVSYTGHVGAPMTTTYDRIDAFSDPPQRNISCPPDRKQCGDTCFPSTQDCCAASEHCLPGDYCYRHSGSVRCCPEGLACFQIRGDVCFERTVVWYEEVHIVDESEDEIITSWDLVESVYPTSSRITVTASYPDEGRAFFTSLSERIVEAAATPVTLALDGIPTRTVTLSAHTTEPMLSDLWSGVEGQVVLEL